MLRAISGPVEAEVVSEYVKSKRGGYFCILVRLLGMFCWERSYPMRRFTVHDVLERCNHYGIRVALDNDDLLVTLPLRLPDNTKFRALRAIRDIESEIIAYLHSTEHETLCPTCLYDNHKRRAIKEYSGIMYCDVHYIIARQGGIQSQASDNVF